MTTELFTPHPLARIHPGDVIQTWCKHHGRLVRHLYQPGKTPPLVCLECHPELEPQPENETTNGIHNACQKP